MGKDHEPARQPAPDNQAAQDPKQQIADRLAELQGHVPQPWIILIQKLPRPVDPTQAKQLQITAYKYLFEKTPGYEPFAAWLSADPANAIYLQAAKDAETAVTADREPYGQLMTTLAELATYRASNDKRDAQIQAIHAACMGSYGRLSMPGRYYLKDRPFVQSLPEADVKQLLTGETKLLPLDPPTKPGDGKDAAADPVVKAQYEALKKDILAQPVDAKTAEAIKGRKALSDRMRATDGRVLDMLRSDIQVSLYLAKISEADRNLIHDAGWIELDRQLDSVGQLYQSIREQGPQIRFQKIKEYLEARPGKTMLPTRQRVLSDNSMAELIGGLAADQQKDINRLVARGTLEKQPGDVIADAAAGAATADQAVEAAAQVVGDPGFADMRSDQLFRVSIEKGNNKLLGHSGGLATTAYEIIIRGWGITPNAPQKDAESALPTDAANPTNDPPPSPQEMATLDPIFTKAVNAIAKELGSTFYVTSSNMSAAFTAFENDCAVPDKRDLFRRAKMNPGVELTKRCNENGKIGNIRDQLHKHVDENARQICERVLGIRIDGAVVGTVGGTVQLADEQNAPKAGGKIPIAQALREIKIAGDVTLSQMTRSRAQIIADKLDAWHMSGGCKPDDVINTFTDYKGKFGCNAEAKDGKPQRRVIDELVDVTGIPEGSIYPIEFLANEFRELPNAKGDLASRINERVDSGKQQSVLLALGLDAKAVADRTKKPEDKPPAGSFQTEADTLYKALLGVQQNTGETVEASSRAAGNAWIHSTTLMQPAQPQQGQPPQPGAATDPSTFADAYKKAYGIDPKRHVVEVARSLAGPNSGRGAKDVASWFQISEADIGAAVVASKDADPADLATLPNTEAKKLAQDIWDGLHKGDVVKVRQPINGRRPEEVERIKLFFSRLSGGIELDFYVRQALEAAKSGNGMMTLVGGEGVHDAGTDKIKDDTLQQPSDEREWTEMVDVAKGGRVEVLTRVKVALDNDNKNEIFAIVDDATREDRKAILGDAATMGQIRAKLGEVDFDRVQAVLMGTADMATRLYSRSQGDVSGSFSRFFTSTDTKGMERDIRDYAKRRKEVHSQELEAAGTPASDPTFKTKVTELVKKDLLAVYDNPDVRKVIENEFNTGWIFDDKDKVNADGRKLEGMMLNGGEEANTQNLASDSNLEWSSDIVAQIKKLTPDQRKRYRNNPAFLQKLNEKANPRQRKLIMMILNSDEPAGEDHIAQLMEADSPTGTNDVRAAVARLTKPEIERLRGEPDLLAIIFKNLPEADREHLRELLGLTPQGAKDTINKDLGLQEQPAPPKTGGPAPAATYHVGNKAAVGMMNQDEVDRLAFLKEQSQLRLHVASHTSWTSLLREAVAVYNADFKPKLTAPPPPTDAPQPGQADANAEQQKLDQSKLTEEAATYETKLRTAVWNDVKDDVFKAADENTKTDKNDADIFRAVLHKQDPSNLRLQDSFHPLANTFNDDDEIDKTIKEASDDIVLNDWSSVVLDKFDGSGGESFQKVYREYEDAKKAVPADGKGASPDATKKLTSATDKFQQYVVEPSSKFEGLILPHAGSWISSDKDKTTKPDQQLTRKNPQFAKYRGMVNDRIRALDSGKVAAVMGIPAGTPEFAMVGGRLRSALTNFKQAQEGYAKERGIDGQGSFGNDEGRQLDRAFGDYRKELNTAQDTKQGGEISDVEKRKLDKYDEDFKARSTEYAAARDAAADIAAKVVGAVIAVAITAASGGVSGPAALMLYGALIGAASATGEVITKAAIKGGANYDVGGEGTYTIVSAAITGAISAGATHYAGALTNSILPSMTAAGQGVAVEGVAKGATPTLWQTMFKMGTQTAIQSTMTGFTDSVGSGLNPTAWVHGWDEGWYRAMQKVSATVRQQPWNIFKSTVSAALGAGITKNVPNLNKGDELKPGELTGDRMIKQVISDVPNNVVTGVISTGMDAAKDGTTPEKAATSIVGSALDGVKASGVGVQDASATHGAEAKEFLVGEISGHPDCFKGQHEAELYAKTVEATHPAAPNAIAFSAMRDVAARIAVGDNPKFKELNPADQRRFLDFVREAKSPEEAKIRGARDPNEAIGTGKVPDVYPPGSEMAKSKTLVGDGKDALAILAAMHDAAQAASHPATPEAAAIEVKRREEELPKAEAALRATKDAEAQIEDKVQKAPKGSPEQVELAKMLIEASSTRKNAERLLGVLHSSLHALRTSAHLPDFTTTKPGEVPANAPPEIRARFEEAKKIYDAVKGDKYKGDEKMAALRWEKYLHDHGVDVAVSKGGAFQDHADEIPREVVPVKAADHTVESGGLVRDRSENAGKLDAKVSKEAFAEACNQALSGVRRVRYERSQGLIIEVVLPDKSVRKITIEHRPPAKCADGQIAGMHALAEDHFEVWASDQLPDDQVVRAFGGVLAEVVAVASKSTGDLKRTAMVGQLDAMLHHIDRIKEMKRPEKSKGEDAAEVTKDATEAAKWEDVARVNAEIDMLLLQLGAQNPGPGREQLMSEVPEAVAKKLELHFKGHQIGFNGEAVLKDGSQIPKPKPADDKMPASQVLPGTPGETHPYTAADQKTVLELQMVFAQIKECDVRIAQRDQKNAQGSGIALGETLKRRELVQRAQKLMSDLQLGGTDSAYYDARLKELEAVFPGIKDTIGPEVKMRVERRQTMEKMHAAAEAARQQLMMDCARIKGAVLGKSPFFTERVVVGDGIAGITDVATLKGADKGAGGYIPPETLLTIGGMDLLAKMAQTDPTMRWGQRPEVFDPAKGMGEENAMFKGGGEGQLQGLSEDPGDFTSVMAMNDAMDLARARLGMAKLEAQVISCELRDAKRPDTPGWPKEAEGYEVRVRVQVDGKIQEIYAHKTDITTGLGAAAAPDETVLAAKDRDALFKANVMFAGDSVLTQPGLKQSLAGQRVLVLGYGPTAAWAAYEAAKLGAMVDWTGSVGAEGGNMESLKALSAIDRVAETVDPASKVHTSTDRVVSIEPQGEGAIVTFARGKGDDTSTYQVHYTKIALSLGYDAAGKRTTQDASQTPKTMLGDTKMGPAKNGSAVLQSTDDKGAIRVMGGSSFGDVNSKMTKEEREQWQATRGSVPVSADSPPNDPRVMEYQDKAITDANKDQVN